MNNAGHNSSSNHGGGGFALPAGVSEEVVLAWVDGELDGAEQARLAREHPGLATLVRAMRDDARRVASLPLARSPEDMAERVTSVLEREALLGMERSAAVDAEPPSMRITTVRRTPAWVPRLAIAAGFVLLAGGAAWLARVAYQSLPSRPPLGPVAALDKKPAELGVSEAEGVRTDADTRVALNAESAPAEGNVAQPMTIAAAPAAGFARDEGAKASLAKGDAPGLSVASAMELAREGRLVIRVHASESVGTKLASANARSWRVVGDAPSGVALALALPRALPAPAERRSEPTVIAGADAAGTGAIVDLQAAREAARSMSKDAGPTALTLELSPDEGTLESVLAALRSNGHDVVVSLEALPPGTTLDDLGIVRQQNAQDLLWWTRPVEAWTPRVLAPVVIERR